MNNRISNIGGCLLPWFVLRSIERMLIICGNVMTINCGYMPLVTHGRTADLKVIQKTPRKSRRIKMI